MDDNMENKNITAVITLYQPWATWIMRGWKTIETRTHNRFSSLQYQKILIHAGKTTDKTAIKNPYLTNEQLRHEPDEMINGFILGSAIVINFAKLNKHNSQDALIDCEHTERYGLFLVDIVRWEVPIGEKGEIGIWYYDAENKVKVRKSDIKTNDLFTV